MKESDKIKLEMKHEEFTNTYQEWLNVRSKLSINTLSKSENIIIDVAHDLIRKVLELHIAKYVKITK